MTDYSWPTDLPPFAQSYWLQPHFGGAESPLTRSRKVYGLSAPRWTTRMSFRGGYSGASGEGAFGGRLDALIDSLEGAVNRVLVYDFRRPTRTGPGRTMAQLAGTTVDFSDGTKFTDGYGFVVAWSGGAPASAAAGAGATSMTFGGFEPLAVIFLAGDYCGGDGRAHRISGNASADFAGNVTVSFKPPLGAAIAAGAGTFSQVTSPFRLVSDEAGANMTEVGQATGYDVELVEDL